MAAHIELRGVRVNNLKGVDLNIPLRRLVAVTGVGGSGKTSLAFQTLHAESLRRYLECLSSSARWRLDKLDPPEADSIGQIPAAVALRQQNIPATRRVTLATLAEAADPLRQIFASAATPICPRCKCAVSSHTASQAAAAVVQLAEGTRVQICFPVDAANVGARELLRAGYARAIVDGATVPLESAGRLPWKAGATVLVVVDRQVASADVMSRLAESIETAYASGGGLCLVLIDDAGSRGGNEGASGSDASPVMQIDGRRLRSRYFTERLTCAVCRVAFPEPDATLFDFHSSWGACPRCRGIGEIPAAALALQEIQSAAPVASGQRRVACPDCQGTRFRPEVRHFRVGDVSLPELLAQPARAARETIACCLAPALEARGSAFAALVPIALARLEALDSVALGHLALDTSLAALTAAERVRARLAAALGAGLADALYVIENPSAGLHPLEIPPMITALRTLRDAGNSLVLVEQNPVVLRESDWIIETGPAAGRHGGLVTFQGTPREFAQRRAGPGAAAARLGPLSEPRQPFAWLTLSGVRNRTLRDVTVRIPLGVLCAVTGVSGSGKRALVLETLVPAIRSALAGEGAAEHANSARAGHWEDLAGVQSIDAVVQIDGAQISRVKRGSLATFLGVMSDIRRRFSATPAAAARGFGPGHFSPKGAGRCQTCQGEGRVEVDMHFLPDVSMVCADCRGARFREEILQVRLRGLSIAEVLALPARDAFTYFRGATRVQRRLKPLADVGLDDLTLDQPVWALSASESSRLKLARHLGQSFRKRALFVVDEPAAGMHHVEVARLVRCFRQLLTEGHSVLIVEHNIELLNEVDYLIEMDRTPAGAAPLALGSPQALAGDPNSRIGRYLGQNGTSRQGDSSKTVRHSSC